MANWISTTKLTDEQRLDVLALLNRTDAVLGREAIDESRRRSVVHGWSAQHWLAHENGQLVGYAIGSPTDNTALEMCGGGFDESLLKTVLSEHDSIQWWLRDPKSKTNGETIRTLQLLRIELPVTTIAIPEGSTLRPFEAMTDKESWLLQNNSAFAHHPEQGTWDIKDLEDRIAEPWFDPSGFLLLEIDGKLCASCWTKVHELHPDRSGEIYVISVDPQFQGRNLGRFMVTQGLAALHKKGVNNAILFVDESNESARKLYASLGFSLLREDQLVLFKN